MPRIKHINADILSDEELTAVSDMLDSAEKKMNEKLMEEIDRRRSGMVKTAQGCGYLLMLITPEADIIAYILIADRLPCRDGQHFSLSCR